MKSNTIVLVKICFEEAIQFSPNGLMYIATNLLKAGFKPVIMHRHINELNGLVEEILSYSPIYIGFSVITADPLRTVANVCREIKEKAPEIPIVFGGVHPSMVPEQCLSDDYIDIVVRRAGEEASVELARTLSDNKNSHDGLKDILGIGYKENGQIKLNELRPLIQDLDKFDIDWKMVDLNKYIICHGGNERVYQAYISSRGCPHDCGFCYNRFFNDKKWRKVSSEKVIRDIETLKSDYKIDAIFFFDDNFMVNKERSFHILQEIGISSRVDARVDYINENTLSQLKKYNCHILLGLESGSDRILKLIDKGFTTKKIYEVINLLHKFPSVQVKCSFIFGYPTETIKEYRATLKLIIYVARLPNVGFTMGFYLPYPQTKLYEMVVERGFIAPQNTENWEFFNRQSNEENEVNWTEGNWLVKGEVDRIRLLVELLVLTKDGKSLLHRLLNILAQIRILMSSYYAFRVIRPIETAFLFFFKRFKPILRNAIMR